jgi:hypothetical protein
MEAKALSQDFCARVVGATWSCRAAAVRCGVEVAMPFNGGKWHWSMTFAHHSSGLSSTASHNTTPGSEPPHLIVRIFLVQSSFYLFFPARI